MKKHLHGFISLLLVFVLCLGMIPSFLITEACAASTQGSIMLFDFADNGNYTTVLNSQLSVPYKPNGTGTTRTANIKNLGWHFARYGNVAYADDPLYCIEPWRNYAASTSGNSVDRDITVNGSYSSHGSNVWYAMPADRREAIGLILLYSDLMWDDSVSVFTTSKANNPNVPLRIATQFLIYEIVCGLRNPTTFVRNSVNECGTSGAVFYNAGVASVSGFASDYNTLVSYIQSALEIPSFTGSSNSNAPTITLTGSETSVYDSNGVLSDFSFSNGNGAQFQKSGNYLHIYQTGVISESSVFTASRYMPSAENSTYNIWYMTGSTYQTTVSLANASYGNVNAYFKLDAPDSGELNLTKATEDGNNLEGWQFGIYSDSACTNLVSGPHTSDSSGELAVTNIAPGTYYIKELGHPDSTVNAQYSCAGDNPQVFTIAAGDTVSIVFENILNKGELKIIKTTNTGESLEGWQIGVYTDAACSDAISGSPFTTEADGTVIVPDLTPGTYYAKEMPLDDPYWICDSSVETVQVIIGQTATVNFSNTHYGDIRITKTAVNGSAEGWSFQIFDANKSLVDTVQTDADGFAHSGLLMPGKYYVTEVHDRDETYWEYDADVEQAVTVTAGSQAEVSFTNTQYGRIRFVKSTNTGSQLGGWTFRVTDSNYEVVGEYTTDEEGYAVTEKLEPGRYTVQELSTDDAYWNIDIVPHDVIVIAGETTDDPWHNCEQGLGWFHKSTNTGESLEGWHITLYEDADCTKEIRTLITDEDGKIGYFMNPGIYYAKETGDEYGRFEDEYWLVDETVQEFEIKPHEDTAVYFTNIQYGKLQITKTVSSHGDIAGWQFKVTDSNGAEIDGSPFTTGEDGVITTGNILPGSYTIEELFPEDSLYQCTTDNPQTVSVTQGKIAEVFFNNCLRSGRIDLKKVDITGNPLAGAVFCLEWSSDGSLWWPVEFSDSEFPEEGHCSNPDIIHGTLTTGEDGLLVWDGLHPGLQYRLTETAAPDGYNILKEPVFEGTLPEDDLTLDIKVINTRIFTMPETGVSTGAVLKILSLAAVAGCLIVIVCRRKKV